MKTVRCLSLGLLGAMFFAVVSCVETSSGGGSSSGDNQQANGGIGGSGSGTVSGYGSVIINGTRKYTVEAQTLLSIDGTPLSAASGGHNLPLGATVEFLLGENVDENLASGTATEIRAFHHVVGPITSRSPLTVLKQPVELESGTQPHGTDLGTLDLNDVVEVAGTMAPDGTLRASRFAAPGTAPLLWRLRGHISNVDNAAGTFAIGDQVINLGTTGTLTNCDSTTLSDGQRVLVLAESGDADLSTLDNVSVECLPEGPAILSGLTDVPDSLPMSYSGVITSGPLDPALELLNSGSLQLEIDGQLVMVTGTTEILDGVLSELVPGTHIDADGLRNADGVLTARRVRILPALTDLITGLLDVLVTRPLEQYIRSPLEDDRTMHMVALRASWKQDISLVGLSPKQDDHIAIEEVSSSRLTTRILAALPDDDVARTELPRDSVFDPRQLALLY